MKLVFFDKNNAPFVSPAKLVFLFLVVFSCNSPDNTILEIDPGTFVENKITLTAIADDIIYIPLESKYSIGLIYSFIITNSSIYLSEKNNGILVFNRDGEMAIKIGNRGRGPGEYSYGMDFAVDDKKGTIYVPDFNKIKVYSKNGDFLRSIILPERENDFNIDRLDFYNSYLFGSQFVSKGNEKYIWIITDTLGNIIKKKENSIPSFFSNWGKRGGAYKFGDKISYWNLYNDTVFSVLPDLSYKASFLFTPGEHRWPRSDFSDMTLFFKYMHPLSLFESNRFLVFRYGLNKRTAIALIDKNSKKSFLTYLENGDSGGILNDLDGGIMFQPDRYYNENGLEYMIGIINPYELKVYVASNAFKNSNPKYPEKKIALEKLANGLEETDNPILMMVKLKK